MADSEPVSIRGIAYSSMREAAKELGVSRSTIWAAREKGTLDLIGWRMPVEVRGTVYPSAKHAADALDVSIQTVYCAVSRRTTETLGLGKGNRTARRGGRKQVPVIIGNVKFKSCSDCARAIGWRPKRVQQTIRKGKSRAKMNLVRAVMEYQARKDRENAP